MNEFIGGCAIGTFLWFFVMRTICGEFRPPQPSPADGFVVAFTDKFGTCYASSFEGFWLNNFLWIWIPIMAAGLIVQLTYRAERPYDKAYWAGRDNLIADISGRRVLAHAAAVLALCAVVWRFS